MGELVLNMLPYALAAAAAAPIVAVVTSVILAESRRPLLSAWTFTAGAAGLVLLFSVAVLAIAAASGVDEGSSDVGAIVDLTLGVVFLGLGLIAVFSTPDPEKEAAQRQRIREAARGGLRTMLITGIVAQVINIDALAVYVGALKEAAVSDVSNAAATVAILVAVAIMLLPYYGPAVVYAISPERSGRQLRRMSEWLLDRSRALEVVVGLGFGAVFLSKGISAI
jgi:threonine/homoserine/homoserine lactone efflux protein